MDKCTDPTPLDFMFVPVRYTGESDWAITIDCERSPENLAENFWSVPDEDGQEWTLVGFDYGLFGRAEFGPIAYLRHDGFAGVHQIQRIPDDGSRKVRASSAMFLTKEKYDHFRKAANKCELEVER